MERSCHSYDDFKETVMAVQPQVRLKAELETYDKNREKLQPDSGKFVLIHGEEVVGIWDTYEDALYSRFSRLARAGHFGPGNRHS